MKTTAKQPKTSQAVQAVQAVQAKVNKQASTTAILRQYKSQTTKQKSEKDQNNNQISHPKTSSLSPTTQLNKKNHKGKGPKSKRKQGPYLPGKKMSIAEIESGDPEISYRIMAQENDIDSKGKFEEEYSSPQLFWRGDSRGPEEVFETGFTSKNERDGKTKSGTNQIIWREGGNTDDILPSSAVCLAKDIRGSAFFPLTGENEFYMYAVAKSSVVNTFAAQKETEKAQTMKTDFKREERYKYDPEYEDSDNASAIWQFQEYAAHRVKPTEILSCFKVQRRTIVPPQNDESVAIAGIQFILSHEENAPIHSLGNKALKKQLYKLQKESKSIAERYSDYYPDEDNFLSYMGIVTPSRKHDLPKTLGESKEKMSQVQPIVIED